MTYLQRKRLAFMSIVNRVKGFVRTITGTPPLTLPDCVDEDSIINYTISGNSVQEGSNIFDIGTSDDYTWNANAVSVSGETLSATAANGGATYAIKNTNYLPGTYCMDAEFTGTKRFLIRLYDDTETLIDNTETSISGWTYSSFYQGWYSTSTPPVTTTIPDNVAFWKLGFVFANTSVVKTYISNIRLWKSSSPDNPIEIESVGEKTANLFGDYVYTDQTTRYYPVISTTETHTFKQGITYIVSFDTSSTGKTVYFHHHAKTAEALTTRILDGTRKAIIITPTEDITTNRVTSVYNALSDGDSTGLCSNCVVEEINQNLFDIHALEQGGITDVNGDLFNSTTRVRTSLVTLEAGMYAIKVNQTNSTYVRGVHIFNCDTEKWEEYRIFNTYNKEFVLSKKSKVRFVFNTSANAVITPEDIVEENPVLALVSPYEPYGYKIPVKASGKNLYADGNVNFTAVKRLTLSHPIKAGTYTISALFDNNSDVYNSGLIFYAGQSGTAIGNSTYIKGERTSRRATFNEDIYELIFYATNAGSTNVGIVASYKDIQIEEGEGTPYEPYVEPITTNIYLNEPLNDADYIDFENQKVVRGINYSSLNALKKWIDYSSQTDGYYKAYSTELKIGSSSAFEPKTFAKCTHLPVGAIYGEVQAIGFTKNAVYISISTDFASNLEELQNWIAENEPIIAYRLVEPTEETIDLSKLPTFKGTTIYSIETNIQPSNMSATYYSTSKGE